MSNIKIRALMGVSALVMTAGAGIAAHAQTQVYGAGSTLIAPYIRQAADCYGSPTALVTEGATASQPATLSTYPPFNFQGTGAAGTPTAPFNCATQQLDPSVTVNYDATGSGAGVQGLYQHNATDYGYVDTAGTAYYPTVDFAFSDAGLNSTSVSVYNNGNVAGDGGKEPVSGKVVNVVAPGVTPGAGQYPNPASTYGPMIQIPMLVAPVDLAFSQTYEKVLGADGTTVTSYQFHTKNKPTNISGAAVNPGVNNLIYLDQATYCKIFNGQITDWNDPAIAALNGVKVTPKITNAAGKLVNGTPYYTIKDPADPAIADPAVSGPKWSVPIQIVGRSDSSGTTSIFTRHLAAVCGSLTGNAFANGSTTLPSSLQGVTYDKTKANNDPTALSGTEVVGKFTLANGSGGVAKYVAFTATPTAGSPVVQGRIGYLGPDYVEPVTSKYGLTAAALLQTNGGKYILPTARAALLAFGAATPPSTYAAAADPSQWVESPNSTEPLANPTIVSAYPIVGTTNFIGYTCYADAPGDAGTTKTAGYKLNRFLYWYVVNKIVSNTAATAPGILAANGFSPLPAAWQTAIKTYFILPQTGLTTGQTQLYLSSKSDIVTVNGTKTTTVFTHNPVCNTVPGA